MGRNWTRKSIEEIFDNMFKKHVKPTKAAGYSGFSFQAQPPVSTSQINFQLYLTMVTDATHSGDNAFPGPLYGFDILGYGQNDDYHAIIERRYLAGATSGDLVSKVSGATWTGVPYVTNNRQLQHLYVIPNASNTAAYRFNYTTTPKYPRLMGTTKTVTDSTVSSSVKYNLQYLNKSSTYTKVLQDMEDWVFANLKEPNLALNVFYLYSTYDFSDNEIKETFSNKYNLNIGSVVNVTL